MPDLFHPIKIAIDGNEANCINRVGSNVYAYELLCAFDQITSELRRNFHLTILLSSPPVADMPPIRPGLSYRVLRPRFLWTQFALPSHLFLAGRQYDAFFTPGHYAPRFCRLPYISSVMDLAFLVYPQQFKKKDLFQLRAWTRYSVSRAKKVVAISKYTRKEIMKFYHRQADDIILAYPGLTNVNSAISPKKQQQLLTNLKISAPYFLYLGTLQPRKNILRLIEAFELFHSSQPNFSNYLLVLAGKNGWLTDEITQKIASSPCADKIIITGFVSNDQKTALLSHALCTFNLGFYEGFGIPALESLAFHTVPIIANNTSLPEVIGGAGFTVDPFSLRQIVKAMLGVCNMSSSDKVRFVQLADKQLQKFSYTKSANQILNALAKLSKS